MWWLAEDLLSVAATVDVDAGWIVLLLLSLLHWWWIAKVARGGAAGLKLLAVMSFL